MSLVTSTAVSTSRAPRARQQQRPRRARTRRTGRRRRFPVNEQVRNFEAAATAPAWSDREPTFFPEYIDKELAA